MSTDCTDRFIHYREIARLVWNLGFLPISELRDWENQHAYERALVSLFEGMVLQPLGFDVLLALPNHPAPRFSVKLKYPTTTLVVNRYEPSNPVGMWDRPPLPIGRGAYDLRFVEFFDWYKLDARDFSLLKVVIEHFAEHPELVGREALVELAACSIWFEDDGESVES